MTTTQRTAVPQPVILDAASVDERTWKRLSGMEQARSKLLWRSGNSVAGLMEVDPYGEVAPHVHHGAHHHVWVLKGHCSILGTELGPGGYAYIPGGVDHGITGVGEDGCLLYYLFLEEK